MMIITICSVTVTTDRRKMTTIRSKVVISNTSLVGQPSKIRLIEPTTGTFLSPESLLIALTIGNSNATPSPSVETSSTVSSA